MKPETLFESLQQLDERILEESELPVRRNWKRWAAAAACICVVAVGMFAVVQARENARWNAITDSYQPGDVLLSTAPVEPETIPDAEGTTDQAGPSVTPPGSSEVAAGQALPKIALSWNTVEQALSVDSAPVAGVMIVGEPLTAEQLAQVIPEVQPEGLKFTDGDALYYLKDGAGGLQSILLRAKSDSWEGNVTILLMDSANPIPRGGCIMEPVPEESVGSLYGLEYHAYQYTYLHGEGDPELYPPTEWLSLLMAFDRGGVSYRLSAEIPADDAANAKAAFSELLYCYAQTERVPDLSTFHYGEYLLRDEALTLEEAKADPDFGAYLPASPAGFHESDFHRFQFEEQQNFLSADWRAGYDHLEWYIAYANENDLTRLTSPEDKENYDLSLYPIPRGESVPQEKWEIVDHPIFRAEELTLDMVKARACTVQDAGDTDGWQMRFSVLFPGNVLVRIDAKGISPDWIYEQINRLG